MNETTERLLEMKEKIEQCEREITSLKGKEEAVMERLNEEWGCSSVKESTDRLAELEEEWKKQKILLDEIVQRLKEDYDWDI